VPDPDTLYYTESRGGSLSNRVLVVNKSREGESLSAPGWYRPRTAPPPSARPGDANHAACRRLAGEATVRRKAHWLDRSLLFAGCLPILDLAGGDILDALQGVTPIMPEVAGQPSLAHLTETKGTKQNDPSTFGGEVCTLALDYPAERQSRR